jgi:hypothetical protein
MSFSLNHIIIVSSRSLSHTHTKRATLTDNNNLNYVVRAAVYKMMIAISADGQGVKKKKKKQTKFDSAQRNVWRGSETSKCDDTKRSNSKGDL